MRIITATLAAVVLSGCTLMPLDDPSEWRSLSSEAIDGVELDYIRIEGLHGFMLNTRWTAFTPEGRYGCMRDLTGVPICSKRR